MDGPGNGRGGESIDAVLRQLLRQGRLDPQAERLAAQGIDRLKTFLGGQSPAGGPSGGPGRGPVAEEVAAEEVVVEAVEEVPGTATLRHVVPLLDGSRAELVVPERLSRADADRIAAFLAVIAIDEATS